MTLVKICGLTNLQDAQFAADCGADLLGFIFYKPSPRYVSPDQVRDIVVHLRNRQSSIANPKFAGVFVNYDLEFVRQMMDYCQLDLAQLHGDESPEFVAQFEGRAFKAVNPQTLAEAETAARNFIVHPESFILLDAYHPTLRGGTGHIADWGMVAKIAAEHKILLAGGLNPHNVAVAIATVKPWAVDVSSGVEASKGKKDLSAVKAFIEAVKTANGNR